MRCPSCGAEITPLMNGWERREWTIYEASAIGAAVAQGATYERRRPVRAATVESDVAVPTLQAAVSGLVGGALGGGLAALAGLSPWWALGLATGGLAMGGAWAVLLGDHRAALWELERLTGRDLDGDERAGAPAAEERQTTRVELVERAQGGGVRRMRWLDLPVSDDDLVKVARAVLTGGRGFSRRDLADILTPEEYRELHRILLDAGLLRPRGGGPQAGVELTQAGRAFLRQYLDVVGGGEWDTSTAHH